MQTSETTDILTHLTTLYGDTEGRAAFKSLEALLERYRPRLAAPRPRKSTQRDAILITYGDMVQEAGTAPLATLTDFLSRRVKGAISIVHILPFYPYSSDDGFAVIDYKTVDPSLGDWVYMANLGLHFRLMFDAVINHVSAQSKWFQRFLADDSRYQDYFITVEDGADLSQVFRPRSLPLTTPVQTTSGRKLVWTTFSPDQIDLNYRNPNVLLDIIDALLFYVEHGAEFIRLDAIAFLWKEVGTASTHLPQTHRIVQLMRAILDKAAPQVALITETNVPHADNISYFGDGANEAQMVYNFSLPPLVLHAFHVGDATKLSRWAETLRLPSDHVTFFNFLASHDGIGLMPARGILSEAEIDAIAQRVQALGGHVSFKTNPDGSQSAYELNINYLDALGNPDAPDEDPDTVARRFLASQAIMLALRGVPGIYFHSLFGSRGWPAGVAQTGRYRTINREKLQRGRLESELDDPSGLRRKIFHPYLQLLKARSNEEAFHPKSSQRILFWREAVFALLRGSPDGNERVLCLHNVSNQPQQITIDPGELPLPPAATLTDLISAHPYRLQDGQLHLSFAPYQVLWLKLHMGAEAPVEQQSQTQGRN